MTQIKICGLRDLPSALTAADAGAAFLGFNFVPSSPRMVKAEEARAIIQEVRQIKGYTAPRMVGVFANQPIRFVNSTVELCGLDLIQFSGDEPLEESQNIRIPTIKAIKVDPNALEEKEIKRVRKLVEVAETMGILPLLDRYEAGVHGGTGKSFSWELVKEVSQDHAIILAGGLTPENVAQAVASAHPWGIDVATGIETAGVNDPHKILRFIQEAQRAESLGTSK